MVHPIYTVTFRAELGSQNSQQFEDLDSKLLLLLAFFR
jgi:hypothetical protein